MHRLQATIWQFLQSCRVIKSQLCIGVRYRNGSKTHQKEARKGVTTLLAVAATWAVAPRVGDALVVVAERGGRRLDPLAEDVLRYDVTSRALELATLRFRVESPLLPLFAPARLPERGAK